MGMNRLRCRGSAAGRISPPSRTMPRVEHRFTGPSYTLGVEEELMIVDAETLELVNGIETMLEAMPATEGDVKPGLMEAVLEIATTPCKDAREAADQHHR